MSSRFDDLRERDSRFILPTYGRYPVAVSHARGTRVFDVQGKEYIDLLAGIAVCGLGHCHPEVTEVIVDQSAKLIHTSNLFYGEEQVILAEKLVRTTHLNQVFFCNSGAEANEAAIKLARRFMQVVQGKDAWEIVTLNGSFHGRTLAAMTATGQPALKKGFSPLPEGFVHAPPEDLDRLREAIRPQTAAVLIEIIQGEGGVRPLSSRYLKGVEQICRENGLLFMVDEVQTGLARTGTMWAHQRHSLQPDIITVAKALANGLPMGAMLASQEAGQGFEPGTHATTFGGGPLLSRIASTVLDVIERDGLADRAEQTGEYALTLFSSLRDRYPDMISDVRGRGLMLGIELTRNGQEIWTALLEAGFLINLSHGKVLRLLPPLIVSLEEIRLFAESLDAILRSVRG